MGQIVRKFEDVETNLLFNLLNMADIILNDIDRRFRAEGARFCQQKKQNYNFYDGLETLLSAFFWVVVQN